MTFPTDGVALVVGASGGIGKAVAKELQGLGVFTDVLRTSRAGPLPMDLTDEASIEAVATLIKAEAAPLRLVFDCTGYLHGDQGGPEKTWGAIDPKAMAHQFAINSIGPALLMKHLLPLLPREGKSMFATISAKVGSIGDNQLGGWYGYRASKAALNQLVKTASIELGRKRPEAICVALHPGTVETKLSAPFAKQNLRLQTPAQSAKAMVGVLLNVTAENTGQLLSYDGTTLPY